MSIHLALPTCRRYGLTSVTWDRDEIAWEPAVELPERDRRSLERCVKLAVLHADSRRTGRSRLDQPWRLTIGPVSSLAPVPQGASDAA